MTKLGMKLKDEELAALLMAAGYDTPRKIRDAADKDLERVVGKAKLEKVRAKLPKAREH